MKLKLLAGSGLILLVLFFTTDIFKGGRDMTEHTFETRTWCVGRFLVDVPKQFEIRPSGHTFDAVRVTALGAGTADDLKRIVQSRIGELQAGVEEEGLALRFIDSWPEQAAMVVSYNIPAVKTKTTTEEAYTLSEGHMFMSKARILSNVVGDTRAENHAALIRVSQAVRPRANNEIPEGVGACIKDAFVALPPMNESSKAIFRDKDAEELNLSVRFSHRFNYPNALPIKPYAKFPYERRIVAKHDGYEHYAVYFRQADGETSYLHHKYIGGKSTPVNGNGLEIKANLSKYSGEPDDPPYDEAVSRMIWNGVLNSIRERGVK